MNKKAIAVLSGLTGMVVGTSLGIGIVSKTIGNSEQKIQKMAEKHFALFLLMNQWVKVKQKGKNLSSYFEKRGYHNIAIYGMSYVGETLVDELMGTGINIAYGIDQNADGLYSDIDVVSLDEVLDDVDVIVVTAITFFNEIEKKLKEKTTAPIISLEEIISDLE